ncbi:hypothetical protein [Geoglobus ahangari]
MVIFRFVEDGREVEVDADRAVEYASKLYESGMVLLYDNSAIRPEEAADKEVVEVMGFVCD